VSGGSLEPTYLVVITRVKCAIAKPATIITIVSSIVRGATGVPNRSIVPGIANPEDVAFSADTV
jgi:hypothetical protein